MKILSKPVGQNLLSAAFTFLFTYTAFHKIFRMNSFREIVNKGLPNELLSQAASVLVPIVELAIALFLISKKTRVVGFIGIMALLTSYNVFIYYNFKFSNHLPCSCGTVFEQLSWNQHLALNFLLILTAALGAWMSTAVRQGNLPITVS